MAIASDRGWGAGDCEAAAETVAVGAAAVGIADGAESDWGAVGGVGVGSDLGEALEAALVALAVAFGETFGSVEGENSWGSGL